MVCEGWQPCSVSPETAWRGQKCEIGRCHGDAARSVLAKVLGDVFAHFHAITAKCHGRTQNSQFGLMGPVLCATSAVQMVAPVWNILDTTSYSGASLAPVADIHTCCSFINSILITLLLYCAGPQHGIVCATNYSYHKFLHLLIQRDTTESLKICNELALLILTYIYWTAYTVFVVCKVALLPMSDKEIKL
jgi:hypothetical protein